MSSPKEKPLTHRQQGAIIAMLSYPTIKAAAAAAGVSERTLKRWLKDPRFATALREAKQASFDHATGLLARHATTAAQSLIVLMAGNDTPPHVKCSAAIAVLKLGRESVVIDDLLDRITQLEESGGEA